MYYGPQYDLVITLYCVAKDCMSQNICLYCIYWITEDVQADVNCIISASGGGCGSDQPPALEAEGHPAV